jgi:hypothetical protein
MGSAVSVDLVEIVGGAKVPADVDAFLNGLRGPTVFRQPGRDRTRARVVAGTLHGNEPSGLRAIHRALCTMVRPAVDTLFFIGGIEAARAEPRFSHRMLPGRRDLNRCFRPPFEGCDGRIAQAALGALRAVRPEAVLDLHNNTGRNPAYGIGTAIDRVRLALSSLFSPLYILSTLKLGTFMEAFDDLAPTVTVECGRAGDPAADRVAYAGLERFLGLDALDSVLLDRERLSVFGEPVRVCLRPGLTVAFEEEADPAANITLDAEIDRHNFETLAAGTRIGWTRRDAAWPLEARDASGLDQSRDLFLVDGGVVKTRRAFTPIMMTTDPEVARTDCLFYAVHRWR